MVWSGPPAPKVRGLKGTPSLLKVGGFETCFGRYPRHPRCCEQTTSRIRCCLQASLSYSLCWIRGVVWSGPPAPKSGVYSITTKGRWDRGVVWSGPPAPNVLGSDSKGTSQIQTLRHFEKKGGAMLPAIMCIFQYLGLRRRTSVEAR